MSNIELIKSIRNKTGLPLKDISKAIEVLGVVDEDKIITYLREQGVLKQQARQDRTTTNGSIFAYVHSGRIGVLVELRCETDFVARSEAFQELGNDLAMHIAAFQPKFLTPEQADSEFLNKELDIARKQLEAEGKPKDKIELILQGKQKKIAEENSLLTQPFLKDSKITVAQKIVEITQVTGEKIEVNRFVVFTL
jgi:Translation elongation factor Ts